MKRKAIALMSGGLDSNVAVRIIHDMGIEIIGVHFTGPFCLCDRGNRGCMSFAKSCAQTLNIELRMIGLGQEYIEIVAAPRFGYGSGMNPCVDCRVLMFSKTKLLMEAEGASFVVTGEVLGQRPMSQMFRKLQLIERESGLEGLIVRPLSAKHLPPTIPELEGWIDRNKLAAIKGRQRREQMELARFLKIGDYPCPSGGCLLTDKNFARRIKDSLQHGALELKDIPALRIGRHFRLPGGGKLVVGRNQEENQRLETLARDKDMLIVPESIQGPTALLQSPNVSPEDLSLAMAITAGYCDGEGTVDMICKKDSLVDKHTSARASRNDMDLVRI